MSNPKTQEPMPWPYYTEKAAAKFLGIDHMFLNGLANNPIRACKRPGKTGTLIQFFNKEDILRLKFKMEEQ